MFQRTVPMYLTCHCYTFRGMYVKDTEFTRVSFSAIRTDRETDLGVIGGTWALKQIYESS